MANSSRNKSDYWTNLAKKNGYPARSVYKLEEIQKKFKIFKNAKNILDVGAAPGSWTAFISKEILKGGGRVVAVDLNELNKPLNENVVEIVGDAFCEENMEKIKVFSPFDIIVSDAAPHTSGNRNIDTARSEEIALSVLNLKDEFLKECGSMVVKIFQGSGMRDVLSAYKSKFPTLRTYKPSVSRSSSFEVYIIATNEDRQ